MFDPNKPIDPDGDVPLPDRESSDQYIYEGGRFIVIEPNGTRFNMTMWVNMWDSDEERAKYKGWHK